MKTATKIKPPRKKQTAPEKHPATMLKNFASITRFAKEKEVSRVAVYSHIQANKITPEYIGLDSEPYIDMDKYRDYAFHK